MYTKTVSVVYLKFKSPVFYLATVSKDNSRREGQRDTGKEKERKTLKFALYYYIFQRKEQN